MAGISTGRDQLILHNFPISGSKTGNAPFNPCIQWGLNGGATCVHWRLPTNPPALNVVCVTLAGPRAHQERRDPSSLLSNAGSTLQTSLPPSPHPLWTSFPPSPTFQTNPSSTGEAIPDPVLGSGDGSGTGGNFREGGGGGDGDSDGGAGDSAGEDGERRGSLLTWAVVQRIVKEKGVALPADMAEYAQKEGLFSVFLDRFIGLQSATWPLAPLVQWSAGLRNRLLADPSFLFKVLAEVAIDSGCATFAEIQKRGDDFWKEFDLYASDMLVGIAMDVALVTMLAPVARFGSAPGAAAKRQSGLQRFLSQLPNSMFEPSIPGQKYSTVQRTATWFVKAVEYGAVGFSCGLVGQGIANSIITLKKTWRANQATEGEVYEEEVKTPPLLKTAALWGVFMAISSNTRYQIVNGLEAVVEGSLVTRRLPLVSQGFTVAVRFGNNVFGGMQFVDWARLSGVQ